MIGMGIWDGQVCDTMSVQDSLDQIREEQNRSDEEDYCGLPVQYTSDGYVKWYMNTGLAPSILFFHNNSISRLYIN